MLKPQVPDLSKLNDIGDLFDGGTWAQAHSCLRAATVMGWLQRTYNVHCPERLVPTSGVWVRLGK